MTMATESIDCDSDAAMNSNARAKCSAAMSDNSVCMGCGQQIFDQWILRVAPNLEWHAACLKCVDCHQFLDETCTCFVRDGKTYCRRDYVRLFGTKCAKCSCAFRPDDVIMRARSRIFHVDCFLCAACGRRLLPGEEFAMRGDTLYCCEHQQEGGADNSPQMFLEMISPADTQGSGEDFIYSPTRDQPLRPHSASSSTGGARGGGTLSGRLSSTSSNNPRSPRQRGAAMLHQQLKTPSFGGGMGGSFDYSNSKESKNTRIRTVLNEKQLHTLRTCYNANPRPDALMKEQLVEMTGLSPRVIRVWFQNKRCKDKKRQILAKHHHSSGGSVGSEDDADKMLMDKNNILGSAGVDGLIGPLTTQPPAVFDPRPSFDPFLPANNPIEIQQFPGLSGLSTSGGSIWPSIPNGNSGRDTMTTTAVGASFLKATNAAAGGALFRSALGSSLQLSPERDTAFQQLVQGFSSRPINPTNPLECFSTTGVLKSECVDSTLLSPSAPLSDLSSSTCSD